MSDTAIEIAAAPAAEVSAPVEAPASSVAAPVTESTESQTTADTSAAPVLDVQSFIMQGLTAIDNPEPSEAEPAAEIVPPVAKEASAVVTESQPEKVAEPAKEPEKPEPKSEEVEKPVETEEAEQPQEPTLSEYFDNIGKTEILTREQIDAQFARAPKAIRDIAAKYSTLALKGQEVVEKIGGEHFLEPLSQIAEGIKSGENFGVFQGILSASGVDGFTNLLEDAMRVAVIETQTGQAKTEGEKHLQSKCLEIVNGVLEARFGQGASLDRLEKLFKYEQQGLLNTTEVDSYFTEEKEANPLLAEKEAEIAQLRSQLEERASQETEKKTQYERAQRDEFDTQANASLDKVLNDFVLTKSILRPIENDSEQISQGKKAAETLLKSYIQQQMKTNPKYAELQKSFQKGEQNTAVYRNGFSSLLDTALFNARDVASGLEALVSQVYQNSRNAKLSETLQITAPTEQEQPPAPPTETTKPLSKAEMTREQWLAHLATELAQT